MSAKFFLALAVAAFAIVLGMVPGAVLGAEFPKPAPTESAPK